MINVVFVGFLMRYSNMINGIFNGIILPYRSIQWLKGSQGARLSVSILNGEPATNGVSQPHDSSVK